MEDRFIPQLITDTLEENYMPYAMSVIVSRAIPEIDGLKPSHRKLLYTMYKMKLLKGNRTKSANVVGQTMKLNPHGDQAIYATLVRLTRGNEALLHPLIDSKGNFGKITSRDMKFAASRYTEVKLDDICETLFRDIDKNTVVFEDNYDGTMKEPKLLPVVFPNILVNPNRGIAVGMASNIAPFNLKEVCEATVQYLLDDETDLSEYMKAPDFPTGGQLIYNKDQMDKIFNTGGGTFKLRSKYVYDKKERCIEIYEIPYTTTVEAIIDKIVELIKSGKIKGISDIRDETELKGLRLTIDLKRGIDPEQLMMKLFKYTPLEDSFACNFNILVDSRPKTLGIKGILDAWTDFRISCIKRQVAFDIEALSRKLHLLKGLGKVLLDIDRAIEIIRNTELDEQVLPNLEAAFDLDDEQANYVADIKLRNINKEYILNKTKDIDSLEKTISDLEKMLNSNRAIKKRIIKELREVSKKYGKDRVTEIIEEQEVAVHNEEAHVENYPVTFFMTEHMYLKKISAASLRMASDHKLKDDDKIVTTIEGENIDDLIFFTDQFNAYKLKAHEVTDHKASVLGNYIPNLLGIDDSERIIAMTATQKYEGSMIYVFENGKVAKVPLLSYVTKTNRRKLVNAFSSKSPLVKALRITNDTDIMMIRQLGDEWSIATVNTSLIPEKSTKSTQGVQVMRMTKESVLIYANQTSEIEMSTEAYRIDGIPKAGTKIDSMKRMRIMKKL